MQSMDGLTFLQASMLVVTAAAAAAELSQFQYNGRMDPVAQDHAATAAAGHPPAERPHLGAAPAAAAQPPAAGVVASSTTHPTPSSPAAGPRPRKPRSRAECVVCLDARPSVTTHPCGHRVLCGGCAALVAAGKGECPYCRAPVVRFEAGTQAGRV
jgi:hypothetical protein